MGEGRRSACSKAQVDVSGFMLDTGALIAVDRGDRRMLALLEAIRDEGAALSVTAPVVAQAWRGGGRQARLASFLKQSVLEILPFTSVDALAAGTLSAMTKHHDVVDVHVVLLARARGHTIVTSDPDDMRRVDPNAPLVEI